jgi:NADPH:quinone reductase-like Zn-dependent oxidoreductase
MATISSLELRTKITSDAKLQLWLEKVTVPKPAADEVVVRIDAAPLNPSDIILLLGPVDPVKIQAGGTPMHPTASASIPPERMRGLEARLDRALPAGNEGAGIVVDAGSDVRALVGRSVAARSPLGMYAQYRVVKASARSGALSCYVVNASLRKTHGGGCGHYKVHRTDSQGRSASRPPWYGAIQSLQVFRGL